MSAPRHTPQPTTGTSGRRRARRESRRPRRTALVAVAGALSVALLAPASTSYADALQAPGAGPWQVATVGWISDHGFAAEVNAVENWWYGINAPSSAPVAGTTPVAPQQQAAPARPAGSAPSPLEPLGPVAGSEGQWTPTGPTVAGAPTAWTTTFRPDPVHPQVTATALEVDQQRTRAVLVPGLTEPGPVPGALPSSVPASLRPRLLATVNAGYKFRDDPGGFSLQGYTPEPLVTGRASLVVGADGRVDIRAWTGGPTPPAGVAAVRQNLDPVVEGGKPVPGLGTNAGRRWGSSGQQLQYTSRTGAGVTADGRLVVVEGPQIQLSTLASTLVQAGAVTGMQLDIHNSQVSVDTFTPDSASSAGTHGTTLSAGQERPADRYLSPDQRDFVALFVR